MHLVRITKHSGGCYMPLQAITYRGKISNTEYGCIGIQPIFSDSSTTVEEYEISSFKQTPSTYPGQNHCHHRKLDGEISNIDLADYTIIRYPLPGFPPDAPQYADVAQSATKTLVCGGDQSGTVGTVSAETYAYAEGKICLLQREVNHANGKYSYFAMAWYYTFRDGKCCFNFTTSSSSVEPTDRAIIEKAVYGEGRFSTTVAPNIEPRFAYKTDFRSLLWLALDCQEIIPGDPSALAGQAYSSAPFYQGNGFALLKELVGFRKGVKEFAAGITQYGPSFVKKAANLYLGIHYGYRLLAYDLRDLYESLISANSVDHRVRAMSSTSCDGHTLTEFYQVRYDPYGALSDPLEKIINLFDLDLDLASVWDSLPFSFVVDWFTNFGDQLNMVDEFVNFSQRHAIRWACYTQKYQAAIPVSRIRPGWTGSLNYSRYTRSFTGLIAPKYDPSVTVNLSTTNIVEAGALTIALTPHH